MATRDSTTDEVDYINSDPPHSLRDIIEEERTRLHTVLTLLGCTKVALNNDPRADEHQFCYGDIVDFARQMIAETTDRLDSVYLRRFYDQLAGYQREALENRVSQQSEPGATDFGSRASAV